MFLGCTQWPKATHRTPGLAFSPKVHRPNVSIAARAQSKTAPAAISALSARVRLSDASQLSGVEDLLGARESKVTLGASKNWQQGTLDGAIVR